MFTTRRGRPPAVKPSRDLGTPELIAKRALQQTTETLDLCLERNLINSVEHWCGIHLRGLYTLRYGVPSVRAVDPAHFGGIEIKVDDPDWRHARELEYQEALIALCKRKLDSMVLNVVVFNQPLSALHRRPKQFSRAETESASLQHLSQLQQGLGVLEELWC